MRENCLSGGNGGLGSGDRVILFSDRFLSVLAGGDIHGENDGIEYIRGIGGVEYVLPLNIEIAAWFHSDLGVEFVLGKEWMLTPRVGIEGEFELDTREVDMEGAVGVEYVVTRSFMLLGKWHSDYGLGGGIGVAF